jgi:DNA-binding FadR family transcriptional regulator
VAGSVASATFRGSERGSLDSVTADVKGAPVRRAAEGIARAIELDIIASDMAPGTRIGSEADLMERYGASRGVIREAVTLVESHMLARTRRGVNGGLMVVEPNERVVVDAVSLFLARQKASEVEVHEIRIALEVLALRKTMAHLDDEARAVLQREMDHELGPDEDIAAASQRFHVALGALSGNQVLRLFVPITTGLVEEMWSKPHPSPTPDQREALWIHVSSCHRRIIEAMLDGRGDLAAALLQVHLEEVAEEIASSAQLVRARPIG